jgi:hypothetical protein
VGLGDLLRRWSRFRDQETVEFAESGIAPADEVKATEERVAEHRHEHDAPEPTDQP